VVVHAPQVVVVERRQRAVEGQDGEPVPGQLQVAHDLGAKQRHHVRRHAEPEPGHDLLGDGGAAEDVAPLQHDDAQPGPGQVRGADEAVVAASDDDRVVALRHGARC
jgi:hypothetical protein